MKRIKKTLISFIVALSLTIVAPNFIPINDFFIVVHVQAKTSYVYRTKTGTKYHCKKCGSGKFYKVKLKDAKADGLTKCKKCYK